MPSAARRRVVLDEATQLPGMRALRTDTALAIRQAHQQGLPLTLALIHCDGLHDLDRTLGRRHADSMLSAAASTLRVVKRSHPGPFHNTRCFSSSGNFEAYRAGAYTFAVLLRDCTAAQALVTATAIQQRLHTHALQLHTTAGLAYRHGAAEPIVGNPITSEQVMQTADAAILYATRNRKDLVIFDVATEAPLQQAIYAAA